MARAIWEGDEADRTLARVDRLRPDAAGRWGRMRAPEMVVHLADQMKLGMGEIPCEPEGGLLSYSPLKQLIIYWVPWPKGAKRPAAIDDPEPGEWERDVADLRDTLARLVEHERAGKPYAIHPGFGRLSRRAWGVLTARHLDHHLRQFGV